jgi:hypothetical protein
MVTGSVVRVPMAAPGRSPGSATPSASAMEASVESPGLRIAAPMVS